MGGLYRGYTAICHWSSVLAQLMCNSWDDWCTSQQATVTEQVLPASSSSENCKSPSFM